MGAPQRLTGRVGHRAIVESIRAPKSSGRGANSSGTWIHGPIFFGGDIERTGIVVVDVSTKYVHFGEGPLKNCPFNQFRAIKELNVTQALITPLQLDVR